MIHVSTFRATSEGAEFCGGGEGERGCAGGNGLIDRDRCMYRKASQGVRWEGMGCWEGRPLSLSMTTKELENAILFIEC